MAGAAIVAAPVAPQAHADDGPAGRTQEPIAPRGSTTFSLNALAAYPGAGAPATASDFTLDAGSDLSGRVAALDSALYKQGVANLLADANHPVKSGSNCPDTFGPAPLRRSETYCFESADANTREWIPQAVTGVSDAQADETWGTSSRPIITGWYDNWNPVREDGGTCTSSVSDACNEKGVRITFVEPATMKYRHVLLVWPYLNSAGNMSYDGLHASENPDQNGIHAGGMVWYGNYLYVADTNDGIRVFDMRYIMDLNPDGDASTNDWTEDGLKSDVTDTRKIGRQSGVYYSFGYRYVMPQVGTWHFRTTQYNTGAATCADNGAPKASYLSLDRSGTDKLIVGEYCRHNTTLPSLGRIGAWPAADLSNFAPGGTVTADSTYFLPVEGLQGAARYNGNWYFNQSHGFANGDIWRAKIDSAGLLMTTGGAIRTATGPEDFYIEHGQGTGRAPRLWSVSEHRPDTPLFDTDPDNDNACADSSPCARTLYSHLLSDVLP
ncbi:hypothetical protein P1P75_21530 [Streptomyces sp. ID05-39B]|uniref:hypothetical protein n=1 Tax=Streptomyces sp. ID05-39B TaxID=3028664 RepID=UPI0029AF933B|nr:hypothetical protein [Streptomyces sp. ID05-39B]MDX3528945.1 hypothetical protein [Streptomyces sp. ID05-39B]